MKSLSFLLALTLCAAALPVVAATPASKKASQNTFAKTTRRVAARAASVVVTTVVGAPIAAPRLFLHNDIEQAKGMPIIGESTRPSSIWISRFVAAPIAGVLAVASAPYYSAVRSWKESEERPFSKECFSLGDYDDSIVQP